MYRRPPPLRKKSGKRFLFDGRGRLYTGYFSYSFGIETINTFIRSRSFLENHTRYQTKSIPVFRPKLSDSNRARAGGGPGPPPHFLEKKKKKIKEKKYKFSNKRNLWLNKNIRPAGLAEASKFMIGPFRSYITWWSSIRLSLHWLRGTHRLF